jgi:hypothetical protein
MSEQREEAKARLHALRMEAKRMEGWLSAAALAEGKVFTVTFAATPAGVWDAGVMSGPGQVLWSSSGAHPEDALHNLLASLREAP